MSTYSPRTVRLAVLTAAVQEPGVPHQKFIDDPKGAALASALNWIEAGRELGIDLQLAAALAIPDSNIPAEAMLDPVACHLPVRTFKDGSGEDLSDEDAQKIIEHCGDDVSICDLGYFDNLLDPDPTVRKQVHQHLLRVARAAVKLKSVGCDGVTGFIGSNPLLDIDQNVALFESEVIPLLRVFQELGLTYYVEQCPMPGWNTTDGFFNNIAYCAAEWIRLFKICEKHGVQDVFRVTYDASHDILMGNTPEGSFATMQEAELGHVITRFHGKDLHRNRAKVAAHTGHGPRAGLGARIDGKPHPEPKKRLGAWGKMVGDHGIPGIATYNPDDELKGLRVNWFSHQFHAREILGIDPESTVFIIEHEWNAARDQNFRRVLEMIAISVAYIRAIDMAADAQHYAATWCDDECLALPGRECDLYDYEGLDEVVQAINDSCEGDTV